eukprot:6189858-Pleurochrysis_carterae.AAC.2
MASDRDRDGCEDDGRSMNKRSHRHRKRETRERARAGFASLGPDPSHHSLFKRTIFLNSVPNILYPVLYPAWHFHRYRNTRTSAVCAPCRRWIRRFSRRGYYMATQALFIRF